MFEIGGVEVVRISCCETTCYLPSYFQNIPPLATLSTKKGGLNRPPTTITRANTSTCIHGKLHHLIPYPNVSTAQNSRLQFLYKHYHLASRTTNEFIVGRCDLAIQLKPLQPGCELPKNLIPNSRSINPSLGQDLDQ